jgi:copper chaperone CopZ
VKTVSLAISGMTCDGCAATVKRVIARVPGVASAEVVLREARATVRGDDGLDAGRVIAAVTAAGYDAREA